MRILIICLFFTACSWSGFAQCTGFGFGGPGSYCANTGTPVSYFIYNSGGNATNCSITNVSGDASSRTWSGSSITWILPGSYTINFACSCGTASQVVIVKGPPTVNATITPNQTICRGATPGPISVPSSTGDIAGWQKKQPSDVTWAFMPGTAGMSTISGTLLDNTTTYQYQMIVNQCSQNVYSSISTITVTQPNPAPPVPVTADITSTCGMQPISISTSYLAGYVVKHNYYDANGVLLAQMATTSPTSTVYNSSYTPIAFFGITKQFLLEVEVVSPTCGSVFSPRRILNYTMNSVPGAPPLFIIRNSQPLTGVINICSGESITVSSSGGTSGFVWRNNSGVQIGTNSATLTSYTPPASPALQTYSLNAVYTDICSNSTNISTTFQVQVNNPTSSLVTPTMAFCAGYSPTFSITLPSAASNISYSWTLSNGATGIMSSYALPPTLAQGAYTLSNTTTADFVGQCQSTKTYTYSYPFTVLPSPGAPLVAGNARFTSGTMTLTASGVFPLPADYNWTSPSGTTHTNTLITPSQSTSVINYAQVSAVGTNGCVGLATQVDISITNPKIIYVSTSGLPIGGSATLGTADVYDTYVWRNSLTQVIGSSATVVVSTPDTYNVTVTKSGVSGNAIFVVDDNLDNQNYNYVAENTILQSGVLNETQVPMLTIGTKVQQVQYFDGIGRPRLTVQTQASPGMNDLVVVQTYDATGREDKKYLPYKSIENTGRYKANGIADQLTFYQGTAKVAVDTNPFATTIFEPSPLNRVAKQGSPGTTWQPTSALTDFTDKSVKRVYGSNTVNEVYMFVYDPASGIVAKSTLNSGYYLQGQLSYTKTMDEKNNEVIEYTDLLGHTICKKVQYGTDGVGTKLYTNTYYLYDNYGNLVIVLSPEAVNKLSGL